MKQTQSHRSLTQAIVGFVFSTALVHCSSSKPATDGGASGASGAGSSVITAGAQAAAGASTAGANSAGANSAGTPNSAAGESALGGSSNGGANPGAGGAAGSPSAAGASLGGAAGNAQTGGATSCPTISEFTTWPSGSAPLEVGKHAADAFLPHTLEGYGGDGYAWAFAYFGDLQFTKLTGDTTTNMKLITDFNQFLSGAKPVPDNPTPMANVNNVDTRAFGDLPLEVYLETGSQAAKDLGLSYANMQLSATYSDGMTLDARRWWADDMFMITSLQVFAYRATGDEAKYLEPMATTLIAHLGKLQNPQDGLFHHTDKSDPYWGRANGWVASGMTELLLELPAGANRDTIMAAYKKQMDGLLKVQLTSGTDPGAWNQVLDYATLKPEMSCTAMFTFALATGVKNGWLTDPKYAAAARNGWLAVAKRTSGDGLLDQVCPGTGDARNVSGLPAQQKFYMDIAFQAGDRHGQGPLLWAARALLRPDCPGRR